LKDYIRRRGENISAFEIERIVNRHPFVVESAAVGVPSELSEEEVKLCVVLKLGAELTHVFEVAIHRGEADVGDLVERPQALHDQFADFPARYLGRAARDPSRIKVIDAALPAEQVAAAALAALGDLWPAAGSA